MCLYFKTFLCFLLAGASFAEALGMCTVAPSSRKRHNNSPNLSNVKVKLESNISSTLNNKKAPSVKNEPTSSDNLHVSYFDIQ